MDDSRREKLMKLREGWLKSVQTESTDETREECRMVLDYHLGSEYDGELYHQYFIRWFDKGKKIDKEEAFIWLKENKNRFTPEMIKYAQSFYECEI